MNEAVIKMMERYDPKTHQQADRALREILQEITLVGLWRARFFEHAAFYGGTALRILYGLDRFSEDLDFTLLDNKRPFDWQVFEKTVVEELFSYGFTVTFSEKKKERASDVQSAFLKTNTQHGLLQIGVKGTLSNQIHPEALIRIKVEIDTDPILGFEVEPKYIQEPLLTSIKVVKESSLFAGKTHAALYRAWKHRIKGRDWYDLVWFLRRNVPMNRKYIEECMRANKELAPDEFLNEGKLKNLLKEKSMQINLSAAKEDVRPFLRDSSQLDLWTVDFFHHWIDKLRFEA